jgi:hypothetical protein
MKELLAFLLSAIFMRMTPAAPVFADEDEGNEEEDFVVLKKIPPQHDYHNSHSRRSG